jgi:hypothetical protein
MTCHANCGQMMCHKVSAATRAVVTRGVAFVTYINLHIQVVYLPPEAVGLPAASEP